MPEAEIAASRRKQGGKRDGGGQKAGMTKEEVLSRDAR